MILVTGASGQLGYDVVEELKKRGIENKATYRHDFDITDYFSVIEYIKNVNPCAIIHCAAYTAVDRAEDEPELCYSINVDGTANIAKTCKELDIKMIYISTDYIFEGNGKDAYEVDDRPNPLGVYGKSKLAGENKVKEYLNKYFIVRISWVFGKNGNNFVKTMIKLGKEHDSVNVVSDQIGSPTYTADLAVLLCDMIKTDKYGVYHATNEGYCSWAEFAEEIFKQLNYKVKVNHIKTEEYPTRAARPKNSKLSKEKLQKMGFSRMPKWENALMEFIESINQIK